MMFFALCVFLVVLSIAGMYMAVKHRQFVEKEARRAEADARSLQSSAKRIFEGEYNKAKTVGGTIAHTARDKL